MLYRSTRGAQKDVPASLAILTGLASDGGLFVPQEMPDLTVSLSDIKNMSYQELACVILKAFLTDFTDEEIRRCVYSAYDSKFDTELIAPLKKTKDAYFLELFHGKTIAFKDMALSILPYLMTVSAKKNDIDKEIVILTATSGDTGKAAMAGFADVPGTRIIVFYPKDGVSPVQERQMVTQKGENTYVVSIKGNFDDAQSAVKKIFSDNEFAKELEEKGFVLSSANSINIGRLVPQIVYYVYAYAQLLKSGAIKEGEKINIVVPTGNFGNILAAYFAKKIIVPVNRLICASNQNRVLTDFFETGTYDKNREFFLTSSPSMDILISSNLERLIFEACGNDAAKTAALMQDLSGKGKYTVTEDMRTVLSQFTGGCASEEECAGAIRRVFEEDSYVIDTHTGVAAAVYDKYLEETHDSTVTVIASTASPYKFGRAVLGAIDEKRFGPHSDEEQFEDMRQVSGTQIPEAIQELLGAEVRHDLTVEKDMLKQTVRKLLGF